MMEKYNIKNMSVSLRTLTVDNKKFTKSMFNQLESKICFNENIDFLGEHIYGYVKEKAERYLIWVHEGKLRKSNLSSYYKISLNASRADYQTTEWFCYKTKTKYTDDEYYQPNDWIKDKERYDLLAGKVHSFLNDLWEKQIFL